MLLPGRLAQTTLGDLLGRLHRGRATGVLEIHALGSGALCAIRFVRGFIDAVELAGESPSQDLRRLLDKAFARLHRADGTIRFLVGLEARRAMRNWVAARSTFGHGANDSSRTSLLLPTDFLHGRPRARDVMASAGSRPRTSPPPRAARPDTSQPPSTSAMPERARAMRLLGVDTLDLPAIRRAFRLSAARIHPDRYPQASEAERKSLHARMRELSEAYHLLCA